MFSIQQVKNLMQQLEIKDAKLKHCESEIKDAWALAKEETARCKAAKDVIRVLTGQVCFIAIFFILFSCICCQNFNFLNHDSAHECALDCPLYFFVEQYKILQSAVFIHDTLLIIY